MNPPAAGFPSGLRLAPAAAFDRAGKDGQRICIESSTVALDRGSPT